MRTIADEIAITQDTKTRYAKVFRILTDTNAVIYQVWDKESKSIVIDSGSYSDVLDFLENNS